MRLLPALLLACLLASPAFGEEPAVVTPQPSSLVARLGTPATADAVDTLLADLFEADAESATALASALGHAGGCAALRGLEAVLRHRAAAVRVAALEAIQHIGLRRKALVDEIRRLVREDGDECRLEAIQALGCVGDGRDMELLLGVAKSEDARVRRCAFRALAALTGATVPYVHARWSYYWKSYRLRAALLLPQALVAIEMDAGAPDAETLGDLVRRYGWVDLPTVRDQLTRWVVEPNEQLRRTACRLIADLRLADLAPEVESAFNFAARPELRTEARAALEALGVPIADAEPTTED